ncbi:uncharacterized protein LOC132060807 [Lycium ferocissimum]|uniref:uncharacterized protein LOC132060807 n=1 Tax=Lycium ferocissimum TaxID=112874 RepID=UPI002815CB5C|nr:uncharacterized protein LOC132060807 [Lycium ferocissimum]
MTDTATSDGAVLNVINKRLRSLRKKHNRIVQMEESLSNGKTLNKEQQETLRSKPAIIAGIDELEKLREPLTSAVAEEINLATSVDSNCDTDGLMLVVEDLVKLFYFGFMFDVKSLLQSDFMLRRMHERACCLSYDCMQEDDDSTDVVDDMLGERDLNLISMVSGLLISRQVNSPLSHKRALEQCIERAKLWIAKSDKQIVPDSDTTCEYYSQTSL